LSFLLFFFSTYVTHEFAHAQHALRNVGSAMNGLCHRQNS